MGRRSRLEIYYDVLLVICKGVQKPTRIMYKSNLSWGPLQEILESLLAQGFIQERVSNKSKRYEITPKGINVLEYYGRAKEVFTTKVVKLRR